MAERNIPFSPPDMSEAEVEAVAEVLRTGWITTGPKTKLFENKIAQYCGMLELRNSMYGTHTQALWHRPRR